MVNQLKHPGQVNGNPAFAFREVCRSVLNFRSLAFVAANAPSEVVSSFEVHQRALARFSLHVASTALVVQLRNRRSESVNSPSGILDRLTKKAKDSFCLAACAVGRVALAGLRVARVWIPKRIQLAMSANILENVGNLLLESELNGGSTSQPFSNSAQRNAATSALSTTAPVSSAVAEDIMRALRISLPNDLSRLIFVSTLRDNNSGDYFHPEVARRYSAQVADQAMLECHARVYEPIVALPIEDLTEQLDVYISTVPVPRDRLLETWSKLRAYRATIPLNSDPISAEIFFMKVEVAVAILQARLGNRVH